MSNPVTDALGIDIPGAEFAIATTGRIFDQGFDSDTCCAHAVAAAMETRMVAQQMLVASVPAVQATVIYSKGHSIRSIPVSLDVVSSGIVSAVGAMMYASS